jgi:molybdopterin molybdotransferase
MAPLSVDEALFRILEGVEPVESETVPLSGAHGRTLAEPLQARYSQPPFDASAMDGYAVRAADVKSLPVRLKVIGTSAAGRRYPGRVGGGQAVRIFTGAPVPDGADAVIIQENTKLDGDLVELTDNTIDAGYIRARGFDFLAGQTLIGAGRRLNARDVALAAAMGHAEVAVRRRPRVALLATGDELVAPGTVPGQDQIVCSNPYGLAAMVGQAGGEARALGIASDSRASLKLKLEEAQGADILVTTGGASVGEHDIVAPVLREQGMVLDFWKIAMRPGKPLLFGRLGPMRVLGLPGNPVSSLVCGRVFLVPLIRRMLGHEGGDFARRRARLATAMPANGPRQHYARARLEPGAEGGLLARPVRSQDSSLLAPLAEADGLIIQPPNVPEWPAGKEIDVLLLDF